MEDRSASHPLSYATPRILFEREPLHRTKNKIAISIVGLMVFFLVLMFGVNISDRQTLLFVCSFCLVFCLVAGVWIYHWLYGGEQLIRITDDGVRDKNRFWSWQQISFVGGYFYDERVVIWFVVDQPLLGPVLPPKPLWTNPCLSIEEFAALCERLQQEVASKHPHLTVEERISTLDYY